MARHGRRRAALIGTLFCAIGVTAFADAPATQPAKPAMSADQMLSSMLKPVAPPGQPVQNGSAPAANDVKSTTGAVAPDAKPQSLIREGSYLVDRTGRLSKTADGQTEFVFDADGKSMKDPPVLLLPNLKLMALEGSLKGATRDMKFTITGLVTEYNGRNYVLLERAVQVPDATQQF